MILFPAIDLIGGEAVRLTEGDFATSHIYNPDPVAQAALFRDAGAQWLHVVDLDGAREGRPMQTELIGRIVQVAGPMKVELGGGLRTDEDLETVFAKGVRRVILGSISVRQPAKVRKWMDRWGADRIVLSPDCRYQDGEFLILTEGWQSGTTLTLAQYLDHYRDHGVESVMVTDVARDGRLTGPNVPLYQALVTRYPHLQVVASGGVATLDDLDALHQAGCHGVIIGKALYEGRFTLEQALERVAAFAPQSPDPQDLP